MSTELATRAAQDVELHELRSDMLSIEAEARALEARRIRVEARIFDIAHARMSGQRMSIRDQEMELRSIALEMGAPLRVHDGSMQRRLVRASSLVERFPATLDALEAGRISAAHVREIHDAGVVITDPTARAAYEKVVIEFAENDTPNRTRVFARSLSEQLHPRDITERHTEAVKGRCVTVTELEDGMAKLVAILPTAHAFAIHDRLTRQAKAVKAADEEARRAHADAVAQGDIESGSAEDVAARELFDTRTRDQVRADLLGATLITGIPAVDTLAGALDSIRAVVQLTIPASTLAGTTTGGGELNGHCVVDDVTARRLAGNAPAWDRVFTDPVTGTVLEVDRYAPLNSHRRFLGARDSRCRTPGCRRPAHEAQIDHNLEWHEGGRTRLNNLCSLCIRHHTLKTETGWTITPGAGGSLEWHSPLGYSYRDDPPKRVVFVPDDTPAPF